MAENVPLTDQNASPDKNVLPAAPDAAKEPAEGDEAGLEADLLEEELEELVIEDFTIDGICGVY